MQIFVRNNEVIKAYKKLTRKLRDDGLFLELKESRFFKSKSEQKRERHKRAIARHNKKQSEALKLFEKTENYHTRKKDDRNKRTRS